MLKKIFTVAIASLPFLATKAYASSDLSGEQAIKMIETSPAVIGSSVTLAIIIALVTFMWASKHGEMRKAITFSLIVLITAGITAQLTISTIVINIQSETKGPVHWHADFEVWECGNPVELQRSTNIWDNKVGSPLFHHHDDQRIHVEGPVIFLESVGLDEFMEEIGGRLTQESLEYIDSENYKHTRKNRDSCGDEEGQVQVFVYSIINQEDGRGNWFFDQRKLEGQEILDYVPAGYTNVPEGDCIIIEFAPEKERTEQLCVSYEVAMERGDIRHAREANN